MDKLAKEVEKPLKTFLPQLKTIKIFVDDGARKRNIYRRNLNIEIDDGVMTSLENKGDGVKSLITIALLSSISSNGNCLIILDEPENHLHPDAIRYIEKVIKTIASENQVLVSTHNPIFVNRNQIGSNIIVDSNKAIKADKVEKIRNILGVICSDNLMFSDYVIVVEGKTDKDILYKFFSEDERFYSLLNNNIITIRSIGGTNNLKNEIISLQRNCCNFIVILDNDNASRIAIKETKDSYGSEVLDVRYLIVGDKKESELEDLYNPNVYSDYLMNQGINISNPKFKNKTLKWSKRIQIIANEAGIDIENEDMDKYKKDISELVNNTTSKAYTEEGYNILLNIRESIIEKYYKMKK